MSVTYPLFVFEKDDSSMRLISTESEILSQLEAIDIKNGEYLIWDATGQGVSIEVRVGSWKSELKAVAPCTPVFPIKDAFISYAKNLSLHEPVTEGEPIGV
jgi:hypothetical protein